MVAAADRGGNRWDVSLTYIILPRMTTREVMTMVTLKSKRQDRSLAHCAGRSVGSEPEAAQVPREQHTGSQPPGSCQPDRTRSRHVSRRPEEFHETWPRSQQPPDRTKNPRTSTETNKTSARKRTRRSPMQTHETSPVSGASVMGMTNGACQGLSYLLAGIPGVSTALG
jgi:septal ring-binding cell division protein DamX